MQPRLAWVLGDPAGIGPELVAKSLVNANMGTVCRPVVVGPMWLLKRGMQVANVAAAANRCQAGKVSEIPPGTVPVVDAGWPEQDFPYGVLSAAAGKLTIEMLRVAVDMARAKQVDGIVFGPLNKEALSKGGNPHKDELHLLAEWLGDTDIGEINAAAGLITTRVTSHIPLKDVAANIRPDRIMLAIRMLHTTLRETGAQNGKIAVAALNPHGGEHGLCGTEEIEIIEPTVARAQVEGLPAVGPFPADTIFLRARKGEFQGIVIMYHDQGQIATKLLGFDQGVTIQGGLSVVITTPAHGTAFDIAGKGIANPEAFQEAVRLAANMAAARTSGHSS
jgi:4-hydroxythreonine-4-phosphate dehydrogenase